MTNNSLFHYPIIGDGACMFRSIAFAVNWYKNPHLSINQIRDNNHSDSQCLRRYVINQLKQKKANNIVPFIDVPSHYSWVQRSKNTYLTYMSDNSAWGTHIELFELNKFVKHLGFNDLQIYMKNSNNKYNIHTNTNMRQKYQNNYQNNNKFTIKLLFSGTTNQERNHYSFLVYNYEKEQRSHFNRHNQIDLCSSSNNQLTQNEISKLLAHGAFNSPSNSKHNKLKEKNLLTQNIPVTNSSVLNSHPLIRKKKQTIAMKLKKMKNKLKRQKSKQK